MNVNKGDVRDIVSDEIKRLYKSRELKEVIREVVTSTIMGLIDEIYFKKSSIKSRMKNI